MSYEIQLTPDKTQRVGNALRRTIGKLGRGIYEECLTAKTEEISRAVGDMVELTSLLMGIEGAKEEDE